MDYYHTEGDATLLRCIYYFIFVLWTEPRFGVNLSENSASQIENSPPFQEEKDGEPGSKPQQLRVASKQQLFGAAAEGQAEAVSTSLQPGRLFKDEVLVLDCEWNGCYKTFSQVITVPIFK